MDKIAYYPGCALKERSSHLDSSARAATKKLGFELDELESWTCCGTVPPVSKERVMNYIPSSRILKNVKDSGEDILITICDFCYNTLKRTNFAIREDEITAKRINSYLADDEPSRVYIEDSTDDWEDYTGDVKVLHLMEYLRDNVGYDKIREKVTNPFDGIKIAPYYGCVMLRPHKEIELDSPENPKIIEGFIESIGGEAVKYPYRTDCCGSYLSVSSPDTSTELCKKILSSAKDRGAQAVVVSCPLCFYNLDSRQSAIIEKYPDFTPIPVFYFTQLLDLALGGKQEEQGFEKHHINVGAVLSGIGQNQIGEIT